MKRRGETAAQAERNAGGRSATGFGAVGFQQSVLTARTKWGWSDLVGQRGLGGQARRGLRGLRGRWLGLRAPCLFLIKAPARPGGAG